LSLDTPEICEPEVTPGTRHTGPGSRLARVSIAAVATAVAVFAVAIYCLVAGPAFGLFASATESAFTEEALLYRRIAYAAAAISLWGAMSGGLSLALEHGEVDRRAQGLIGLIAGLLLPVAVGLGLRWAFEVAARVHFGGM
jgi:hypothetical protein